MRARDRPKTIAGMLSAALLLSPGCGRNDEAKAPGREEPVRRAVFRSLIARDFLASCPAGAARPETLREAGRFEELRRLALQKGAGHAVWLGQNDYAGLSGHADAERCEPGEEAYGAALARYGGTLDAMAASAAAFRP
jgi:hypothetical protein